MKLEASSLIKAVAEKYGQRRGCFYEEYEIDECIGEMGLSVLQDEE